MNTKTYTISHLSDLHLTASDDEPRSEPKFWSSLTGMNSAFRKIIATPQVRESDLIIITGDVADRGDPAAWRVFWRAVSGAGLNDRILVLPGNHDTCHLGMRLRLGSSLEKQGDRAKAKIGLTMGNQDVDFPWVRQPCDNVAIFGLDSNNAGNKSFADNAVGRLSFPKLLALANKLHKYRKVPVKIVALHHSPNLPQTNTAIRRGEQPPGTIARLTLEMDETARRMLRLVCIAQGVRLIIHGHLHSLSDRKVNGLRIIGAPASTQPIQRENGKSVYEFCHYRISGRTPVVRFESCRVSV